MRRKQHTPRKIVATFLRSDSSIKALTLIDVSKVLNRQSGGNVTEMTNRLQKALRGKQLFEYVSEEGQTFYETKRALQRRLRVPVGTPESTYINAPDSVLA